MPFAKDKWNHKNIELLIKHVRVHPCLWDKAAPDYKSLHSREDAFNEIAERMHMSAEDVRCKYRNLRSQYNKELRKINNGKGYITKWMYFNALKFLNCDAASEDWDLLNATDSALAHEMSENEIDEDTLSENAYMLETLEELTTAHSEQDEELYEENYLNEDTEFQSIHSDQQGPPSKKRCREDDGAGNFVLRGVDKQRKNNSTVLVMKGKRKSRDKHTIFGENVANELRMLKDRPDLQHSLKCAVLQAVLDINKAAYQARTILPNKYEKL